MVRIVTFNKEKLAKNIDDYSVKNVSFLKDIAKKSKIDKITIYNLKRTGRGFMSTIQKLQKIGVKVDDIDLQNYK